MAASQAGTLGGPEDIQTAWKLLAGGAPVAAAALVDIAENGKSELARVQASTAVLDRVGLATPKERPSVTFAVIPKEAQEYGITQQISPAEVIRARLKELGPSVQAQLEAAQNAVPPPWESQPDFAYATTHPHSHPDPSDDPADPDPDSEPIDAEIVSDDPADPTWLQDGNPWA